VLEGFDFGVGMLMEPLARVGIGDPEPTRRTLLNTIGPVWDGNEVWLIVAGAAMFAAFRTTWPFSVNYPISKQRALLPDSTPY